MFEYGSGGLYNKSFRSYKVVWHSGSRDGRLMAQTTTKQQTLPGSTPDYHKPQPPSGMAYNQSQSNTHSQGVSPPTIQLRQAGKYKGKMEIKAKESSYIYKRKVKHIETLPINLCNYIARKQFYYHI